MIRITTRKVFKYCQIGGLHLGFMNSLWFSNIRSWYKYRYILIWINGMHFSERLLLKLKWYNTNLELIFALPMPHSNFEFIKMLWFWEKRNNNYMKILKYSFDWANMVYIQLHQVDEIWLNKRPNTYLSKNVKDKLYVFY